MEQKRIQRISHELNQQLEMNNDTFITLDKNSSEETQSELEHVPIKLNTILTIKKSDNGYANFALSEYYYYCESFSYRLWNGVFIPAISLVHEKERLSVYWHGIIGIKLNPYKYCTSCHKEIDHLDDLGYCSRCQTILRNKQHCCRITGAGKPFNAICDPLNPVCADKERSVDVCQKNHIFYVLRINSKLKVGISAQNREFCPDGYLYRIIEQGADEAWVWKNKKGKNLAEIQEIEEIITKVFNITDRLTTNEKIVLRRQPYIEPISEEFNELIANIQNYLGLDWEIEHYPDLMFATLFSPEIPLEQIISRYQHAEVWHFDRQLIGTIVATWGKLSLIEMQNKDVIVSLKDLEQRLWGTAELGW